MYNVSRGPSRIINRTRRDITQKLESIDQVRENLTRKTSPVNDTEDATTATGTMSSPRPTFQQQDSGRGKGGGRGERQQNGRAGAQQQHQEIAPQHEELIRYFSDSWSRVCKDMDMNRQNGGHDNRGGGGGGSSGGGNQIIYYHDEGAAAHQALENFVPFDLEAWWGKRIYQKMTQST